MSIERARELSREALALLGEGRFEEALARAEQAVALAPHDAEAHIQRGIALSSLGRAEDAERAFQDAQTYSPYSAKARYNHAVHRFQQDDLQGALNLADEAVKLDPRHESARTLRDQLREAMGLIPASDPKPRPQEAPAPVPMQPLPPDPGAPYAPGRHQLLFVEKLGPVWRFVGWALAALNLASNTVYTRLVSANVPRDAGFMDESVMRAARDPNLQMAIIGMLGSWVAIFLFTAFDIADKRASWLWLLPISVCSCMLGWLLLPIYLLTVRKPA